MLIENYSGLTLVTPPTGNPVSVADARAHSRILDSAHDTLIAGYLSSSTTLCEDKCWRAFMPQTWRLALNQWPGRTPGIGYYEPSNVAEYYRFNFIALPRPPLVSIAAFTYTDTQGNVFNMQQGYDSAVGNYVLDTEPEPGRVGLPFAGIWPVTILLPHSPIKITFNCGYSAWTGVMNIDAAGNATWVSGPVFDPSLAGSWVSVHVTAGSPINMAQAGSFNVLSVAADGKSMVLVLPTPPSVMPLPVTLPANNVVWNGNNVPMAIRTAILYLAAHRYENREPIQVQRGLVAVEVPETVDALLAPYKQWMV